MFGTLRYGLKQKNSEYLRGYTIFFLIWLSFWTFLITILVSNPAMIKEYGLIIQFIGWFFLQAIFSGPFYLIQILWARRTRRISEEAKRWSAIYQHKKKEQAQMITKVNIDKQKSIKKINALQQQLQASQQIAFHGQQRTNESERKLSILKKRLKKKEEQERKKDKEQKNKVKMAKNLECALRYEDAAKIYEELGMWDDAGRVRMKNIELHAPKSIFKGHNIQIGDSTTIQDSVVQRSNIGTEYKQKKEPDVD